MKLLILALVLCLPMLGCAGAEQLDPTSTVSGASTETEGNDWSGETPSQTLPNDGTASRTIEFDFTSEEGWHYSGSLPWPEQTIALEKDISQSPPGSARLRIAVSGDSAEPSTFANDNPGRNGPDLTISAGEFAYEIPAGIPFVDPAGTPCLANGNGTYNFEPFDQEIVCLPDGDAAGSASNDSEEAVVDQLVSQGVGRGPVYMVSFVPFGNDCKIFIFPDGQVKYPSGDSPPGGSCGTAVVTPYP